MKFLFLLDFNFFTRHSHSLSNKLFPTSQIVNILILIGTKYYLSPYLSQLLVSKQKKNVWGCGGTEWNRGTTLKMGRNILSFLLKAFGQTKVMAVGEWQKQFPQLTTVTFPLLWPHNYTYFFSKKIPPLSPTPTGDWEWPALFPPGSMQRHSYWHTTRRSLRESTMEAQGHVTPFSKKPLWKWS